MEPTTLGGRGWLRCEPAMEPAANETDLMEGAMEPSARLLLERIEAGRDGTFDPALEPAIEPNAAADPAFPLPINDIAFEPTFEPVCEPTFDPAIEPACEPTFDPALEPA